MRISRQYAAFKENIELQSKNNELFGLSTSYPEYNFIMSNGVELFSYRCFILLVATDNFQMTAKLLRMSPYGLSRRLLGLQQRVRIKLVDSNDSWRVTPDGLAFAENLAPRLKEFYDAVRSICELDA